MKSLLRYVGYALMLLVVIVIARIVGGAAGRHSAESTVASRSAKLAAGTDMLDQVSKELNAKLPEMIDENIRLDTTRSGPGMSLSYIHSFPEWSSDELDFESIRGPLATNAKPVVCGSPEAVAMLRAGVTIHYVFNTNDGVEIAKASFDAGDCETPP